MPRRYRYLGDRATDPALKGRECVAVERPDGKCITGGSKMLVRIDGETHARVVLRRQLRKAPAASLTPAASSRKEKEQHPERYCGAKRCLWRRSSGPCPKHGETIDLMERLQEYLAKNPARAVDQE